MNGTIYLYHIQEIKNKTMEQCMRSFKEIYSALLVDFVDVIVNLFANEHISFDRGK